MNKVILLFLSGIMALLLTGCFGSKVTYIKRDCPYVKPIKVELRKNKDGTLNKFYTDKAYAALAYLVPETQRVYELNKNKD